MKKVLKRIGIIFIILIAIIVLFILISYIYHRIQISKEDAIYVPIGQQVEVNGHMMNVYSEGNGETTLVFMSGSGTCSPVLDFKSLYSLLSDDYKIVVVEKAGYGFSEDSDVVRDIDTILSETRQALSAAEITEPFVLCPHSMSGIEALYWAQRYPGEITAIIGLDMAVPAAYENDDINMTTVQLSAFAAHIGIIRWFPSFAESEAIKHGTLTEEEKKLYRAVFYRRTLTTAMMNEIEQIKENADFVGKSGVPNIPFLMFASNGTGTGWNEDEWRELQYDYLENTKNGILIELDCSHYVHDIEYVQIAEEIKQFLNELQE